MAIIHFTSDFERIPVDAVDVREITDQYKGHFPKDKESRLWSYKTHVGLCISDHEINRTDDSDWYMTVWSVEKNKPEFICFASTRGWSYPAYGSAPDATPEVLEKYNKYREQEREKALLREQEIERKTVRKYKEVVVVSGRKVPIGTQGRVFWIGSNRWGVSVGIEEKNGKRHFTSEDNVEVVEVNV